MINIASERIDILFDLAEEEAASYNFQRANRYVVLARKIGMRYNVRIPRRYHGRYCKNCHSYLVPSYNLRVRIKNKKIVRFCENCGFFIRMPIAKERKMKKKTKI